MNVYTEKWWRRPITMDLMDELWWKWWWLGLLVAFWCLEIVLWSPLWCGLMPSLNNRWDRVLCRLWKSLDPTAFTKIVWFVTNPCVCGGGGYGQAGTALLQTFWSVQSKRGWYSWLCFHEIFAKIFMKSLGNMMRILDASIHYSTQLKIKLIIWK